MASDTWVSLWSFWGSCILPLSTASSPLFLICLRAKWHVTLDSYDWISPVCILVLKSSCGGSVDWVLGKEVTHPTHYFPDIKRCYPLLLSVFMEKSQEPIWSSRLVVALLEWGGGVTAPHLLFVANLDIKGLSHISLRAPWPLIPTKQIHNSADYMTWIFPLHFKKSSSN